MNRVGLITIHNSTNYGALLQAYALQTYIESLGLTCEIIDHDKFGGGKNPMENKDKRCSRVKWVSSYLLLVIRNPGILKMQLINRKKSRIIGNKVKDQCDIFRKRYLHIGPIFYETESQIVDNPPNYDYYVCGSDQIWSPLRFSYSGPFYLNFVPADGKRIAYAPSIAVENIPVELKQGYKKYLSQFDMLSVRETKGAEEIKDIVEREVSVLPDPTLLLARDKWSELSIPPKIKERYIFCYFINHANLASLRRKINEYASKYHAKVVVLLARYTAMDKNWITQEDAGPQEFLGYIESAFAVFTDSFHGLVLSLNFNKRFFVCAHNNKLPLISRFARLENILDITNTTDRIVDETINLPKTDIDYEHINSILQQEVEKAKGYLCKAFDIPVRSQNEDTNLL